MPDDDKLSTILIHVGETRAGLDGLQASVQQVREEVRQIGRDSVPKGECTERHIVVANSIASLRSDLGEIKGDVKAIRRQTGQEHRAISDDVLKAGAEQRSGLNRLLSSQRGLKYWISLSVGLIAVLSFVGSVLWGVANVGRYIERVDAMAEASRRAQVKLERKIDQTKEVARSQRVIYMLPDAGAPDAGRARGHGR